MKLSKAKQTYLDWKGTYAKRAAYNYRAWLDYFIKCNGDKKLTDCDIQDLVKYKNWLEDKYSQCTVQYGMVVLHNFFKFWRLKGENTLQPELVKIGKSYPKSHRAVTEQEYLSMLSSIDEPTFIALRDRLVLCMLWDTGVRISELCDLNVEQFSKDRRTCVIVTKKNNRNRIIAWSESTHVLLYKYLLLRQTITSASPLFLCHSYNSSKFSRRLTVRSMERHIRYYANKAGIADKVTPHSFRHGWAHHRLNQRASLPFIQRGLGHCNPTSTHVYLQYNDKDFEMEAQEYL